MVRGLLARMVLPRMVFLLWLLFAGGVAGANPAAVPAPLVVHFTRADLLQESGAPTPVMEHVDAAALQGTWSAVSLPHVLPVEVTGSAPTASSRLRTVWFRISLDEFKDTRGPAHLYLTRWRAAGQLAVYVDGRLAFRSTGSPAWNSFSRAPLLLPLNRGADSSPSATLLIRIDDVSTRQGGIASLYAGDPSTLIATATRRDWIERQFPFMSSAAFMAVGLFALAVWLFGRREPIYLLLFAIASLNMVRRWHYHLGLERLPLPDGWFIWLTLNASLWHIIALHYYLLLLHGRRLPWFNRALLAFAGVFFAITLTAVLNPLPAVLVMVSYAQLSLIVTGVAVSLAASWHCWRVRSVDGLLLCAAYLPGLAFVIHDWTIVSFWVDLEARHLSPYAPILLFVAFAVIMFRRYVGALDNVARINAGLEERLKKREADLAESYAKLRDAEQRQILSAERQRLTQDMHDGLGSSLVSALHVVESGRMTDTQLGEVLKSCIDDLKLTIDSLEPVEADLLLLLATLRFRLEPRLESAGITLRWEVSEVPKLDWLDPRNSLHILRILQEAFANILKHTKATEIEVTTASADGWISVTIADNGAGFDGAPARQGNGFGLANQRRRAEAIGGEVGIESSSLGTRLTLRLPRQRSEAEPLSGPPV